MSKVLVIDNGSYNIKIGYATEGHATTSAPSSGSGSSSSGSSSSSSLQPYLVPNCIAHGKNKRSYIGSQFSGCLDYSGLTFQRPHEKVSVDQFLFLFYFLLFKFYI